MNSSAQLEATRVLLSTSDSGAWHGIPFDLVQSASAGSYGAEPYDCYWLAVIRRGTCDVTQRTASVAQNVRFLPSSFAGYNPGQHWDAVSYEGPVEAITFRINVNGSEEDHFLSQIPKIGNFPCAQDAAVLTLAESMLSEFRQGSPSGRLYAESLSVAMTARLGGLTRSLSTAHSTSQQPKLPHRSSQMVSAFVEANIANDLSIASLANIVGMGATNFCRCFKGSFGMSVHQYVLQRRLSRAQLLLDSDACLAEVALECGFSSQSRFTDAFRKAMGTTPARYRTALRVTSLV